MGYIDRIAIHDRIRLIALLVFVGSLPFDLLILNNIALFLLALNWVLESKLTLKVKRLKEKWIVLIFIQVFLFYLVGLLYSKNYSHGFFEIEKKLTIFFLPIFLCTSNDLKLDDVKRIIKIFIFFTTIASIICYAYAIYLNYQEGHTLTYVFNAVFNDIHLPDRYLYFNYWYFTYELFAKPIHMHPVYFAMYLVFSSCLSVWLWWDRNNEYKKRNKFLILFLLFNFITVVLLASRTQLFILLLFGTFFILYHSYLKKKIVIGLVSILSVYILGLSFILLNPVSRERFIDSNKLNAHFSDNKYGEGGLSLRLYKWKYTLEAIKKNPLLGTGTGSSQDLLQKIYKENEFKIGYEFKFNAHNQFLQVALELGIFGLLSFLISLIGAFYLSIKQGKTLYLVFLLLFVISCLTESMLEVNKGIVFFAFFNSLFAFQFPYKESADKQSEIE